MPAAPAAIPPNPKIAAIIANTMKIMVHFNIIWLFKGLWNSRGYPSHNHKDALILGDEVVQSAESLTQLDGHGWGVTFRFYRLKQVG